VIDCIDHKPKQKLDFSAEDEGKENMSHAVNFTVSEVGNIQESRLRI
jgi:hypothetical protein